MIRRSGRHVGELRGICPQLPQCQERLLAPSPHLRRSVLRLTPHRYHLDMDEANEEAIQRLFAPSSGSKPSTSAELLERIDIDDLMLQLDTDRLLRSPVPCVVDTEFFYSAFQSQLKHGGTPRSLQPAMEGEVRLFMAEETFEELVEKKLPKFATQLGTTTAVLENFLGTVLARLAEPGRAAN